MTREEALKVLDTIPTIGDQVDALEMAIEALSARPTEWIPCSERLPEENETVLISAKYIGHLSKNEPYVEEGFLTHNGWYSTCGDNYNELLAKVVAWMPLPMPYREDGE